MDSTYLPAQMVPEIQTAEQRLQALRSAEINRPIQTDEEYRSAGRLLIQVKDFRKEWDSLTDQTRDFAHKAHKAACAMFNAIDKPLSEIERRIQPLITDYDNRKQALERAREAEINVAIRKECETVAEKTGQPIVPLVVTIPKLTAPDGLARRSNWKARVVDFKALVKAVASGKVPLAALQPACADKGENDRGNYLDIQAKALKGEFNNLKTIPGVEAVEEASFFQKAR